jgi:hypothetical protein
MMTKEQVHQAIDRLNDEQLNKVQAVLEQLHTDDPRERWRSIPGLRIPEQWPPDYGGFDPVRLEGEPVSEQLIRERR